MLLIQSLGLGVPGNVGESVCLQKGFVFGAVQHLTHETEGAGGEGQRFLKHRFKDLARILSAEGLLLSAGDSGKQANGGIISFIAVRRSSDGNEGNDHCLQSSSYIIRYFGCGQWLRQVAVDSSKDKVGVLYIMYIMYIKPR